MFDPTLTHMHSTFTSAKLTSLTRTACTFGVERATKWKEPLNMVMAPVNQRTIGEMELVPSAVGPNTIEQRCQIAKVRILQQVWSPEARNPFLVLWGRVIDKRARPEGPLVRRLRKASRIPRRGFFLFPCTEGADPFIRKRQRAEQRAAKTNCASARPLRAKQKTAVCFRRSSSALSVR